MTSLVTDRSRSDEPVIAIEGVDKFFLSREGAVRALEPIDLNIAPGEFVCIVGPSGCGKSTLLRIIGGLEQATSGRVLVEGAAGNHSTAAFVFQEYGLFPWLTVRQNAEFGLRMDGVSRGERSRRAREWLDRVGLTDFVDAYPNELSGGMRQRLSLARAFATDPKVLLMDEPMGALDAQTRQLLQEDLLRLWQSTGKTVVLVTHSIDEAILLADRIVVMTHRPGMVKSEFSVDLPRPRPENVATLPEFAALHARVWSELRHEVEVSLEAAS